MLKNASAISVTKRDGRKELLDLAKLHKMTDEACAGISGVSASLVEMNSGIQFYDGIKTKDIQEILVRSASDLISLDNPGYQYVAARLLLFGLRKMVFGQFKYIPLVDLVKKNIVRGVYDKELLSLYTEEEWTKLDGFMNHERDFNFTYAGLRQITDKYLVQDRSNGDMFETPQYMFLLIAAILFSKYPVQTRLRYVKDYYDATSLGLINIPTPIMSGVRTPIRQFASCVLVDIDDTLPSIFSSATAIGYYVAQRAGIGINAGRIRGINSKIRGGEVQHTGVIPFLKVLEATTKSCSQNGIRGGSSTVYFPIWHQEIEDIIVLKNNKGTEDNRTRKLDFGIQLSKIFYERFLKNEEISLFSPHDVPNLYNVWGMPEFDDVYKKYENDKSIPKKKINAVTLFTNLLKERLETGRIYIMNIDHSNSHSSFLEQVTQSNLCCEITLPTKPIQHIDDPLGQIATCILSAINVGKIKKISDLELLCDLAVRGLDELIDYQKYPVKAAETFTQKYRALGIGYIGLAHYLAKNKLKYGDQGAWTLVEELSEAFQFYLLKSSVELAKEKGACEKYSATKYSQGLLPIDHYKKDVDLIVPHNPKQDWEALRKEIKQHGLRNTTLSAIMPSESSSVTSNATNGIEPPRDHLSIKKSKKGPLKQIVPSYQTLKKEYTLLWDMPNNDGYLKVCAVIQKYFDQAMSVNTNYNPLHFPNNEISMATMMQDLFIAYKWGIKTLYYSNTYDMKSDSDIPLNNLTSTAPSPSIETVSQDDDCESCKI